MTPPLRGEGVIRQSHAEVGKCDVGCVSLNYVSELAIEERCAAS